MNPQTGSEQKHGPEILWIRGTHPYAFRSGEWAKVVTTVPSNDRECWFVEWPDGVTDFFPIEGSGYELEIVLAETAPEVAR